MRLTHGSPTEHNVLFAQRAMQSVNAVAVVPCRCCRRCQSVMRCHVMSRHVMSCLAISCHIMSCLVISCHVVSCHDMWLSVLWCQLPPVGHGSHVVALLLSCHATVSPMSCQGRVAVMSRHVTSCHVMSCHSMSCGHGCQ